MRQAYLLLLLGVAGISYGHETERPHAHYGGRVYYSAPCNRRWCGMCDNIRAQISSYQHRQPTQQVTYVTPQVQLAPKLQVSTTTDIISEYVFVPTPDRAIESLLGIVSPTRGQVVYDLGCGNADILKQAYNMYGAKGVGIEINPETVKLAMLNVAGLPITIVEGDIARYPLDGADIVTMYLYPEVMETVKWSTLKPGAKVISYLHDIPGLPTEVHTCQIDGNDHEFFLYKHPIIVESSKPNFDWMRKPKFDWGRVIKAKPKKVTWRQDIMVVMITRPNCPPCEVWKAIVKPRLIQDSIYVQIKSAVGENAHRITPAIKVRVRQSSGRIVEQWYGDIGYEAILNAARIIKEI